MKVGHTTLNVYVSSPIASDQSRVAFTLRYITSGYPAFQFLNQACLRLPEELGINVGAASGQHQAAKESQLSHTRSEKSCSVSRVTRDSSLFLPLFITI